MVVASGTQGLCVNERADASGKLLKGRGVALLERRAKVTKVAGGAAERWKSRRGTAAARETGAGGGRGDPRVPESAAAGHAAQASSRGGSWRSAVERRGRPKRAARQSDSAVLGPSKYAHENSHFGRLLRGREGLVDGVRLLELGLIGDLEEGVPAARLVQHEHGICEICDEMKTLFFNKPLNLLTRHQTSISCSASNASAAVSCA